MSRNKKLIAETRLTVLCKTIERLSLTNKGTHMTCKRCPHHVKHGQIASDGKSMVFKDLCGLRLKQTMDPETTAKKTRSRGRPPAEIVPRKPLPPVRQPTASTFPSTSNLITLPVQLTKKFLQVRESRMERSRPEIFNTQKK